MNALELKNVCKRYDGFALDHVDITLPSGCIMGFIGENGAGKSTTIKLILDLISRDEGSISVLGRDNRQSDKRWKEQIGVVMDECCFPENLNLKEINQIMRRMYTAWDERMFWDFANRFSLPAKKPIREFSKGMKMKCSIAAALSHKPKLLLLDEATSGLDPIVRDEILDVFLEFIQDDSHAVFMSSHIVSDLEKACDYITFLHKGKVVFCEEKDRLKQQYGVLHCSEEQARGLPGSAILGRRKHQFGMEALVRREAVCPGLVVEPASVEDIMLFYHRGEVQ